jgi:hypothetical protein
LTTATANAASGRLRSERARQRRELRGASPQELVRAIVHPTPELASYRLANLLGQGRDNSLFRYFGPARRARTLRRVNMAPNLCLRDLSERRRHELANAILAEAPRRWVNGD